MIKARHFTGSQLKAEIREAVTMMKLKSRSATFGSAGDYYDEIDIRKRYADKPEQAENILRSSHTFMHPIRNVQVYLDANYSAKVEHHQYEEQRLKREVSTCGTVKGEPKTKRSKARPTQGIENGAEEKLTPIPASIVRKMEKFPEKVQIILNELEAHAETCADSKMHRYVSEHQRTKAQTTISLLKESAAKVNEWIDKKEGKKQEVKEFGASMAGLIKEAEKLKDVIAGAIEDAQQAQTE